MKKENLFAQVQQLHERGYSVRGIAQVTGISKSSVGRIIKELQYSGLGTVTGTRPALAPDVAGTAVGTKAETVPEGGWDILGTLQSSENGVAKPVMQPKEQDNHALMGFLRLQCKLSLQRSYQEFLYNTCAFLTKDLINEELAHSLIKSRHESVRNFINSSLRDCLYCQVEYWELFIAYVLGELSNFLGQQPELEKTEGGLKIKAGFMFVQFIKQIERLDVFTPLEDDMPCFPET